MIDNMYSGEKNNLKKHMWEISLLFSSTRLFFTYCYPNKLDCYNSHTNKNDEYEYKLNIK
jgi:hypothetical protein